MKQFIRVIAFDDGFFSKKSSSTYLVGVVYRLNGLVEGIVSGKIRVDGFDSTKKIISLCKKKFLPQLRFILLDGINFAGFNVADVEKIFRETGLPVIIVFRRKPCLPKIFKALKKLSNSGKRIKLIEKGGKIHEFKGICFQFIGTGEKTAKQIIKKASVNSFLPEPIRLAHLIASGITLGESTKP